MLMNGDCYGSLTSHMDNPNTPSGRRDGVERDAANERSVSEQIRRLQQQRQEQQHMLQQAAQIMARGGAHGGAAAAAVAAASGTRDNAVLAEAAAYLSASPAAAISNLSSQRLPALLGMGRMGQGGADLTSLAAMSDLRTLGSADYSALGVASGLAGISSAHSPAESASGQLGIFGGGSGLPSGLSSHDVQLLHQLQQRGAFTMSSAASSLGDSLGLGASPRMGALDASAGNIYRGLGLTALTGGADSGILTAHQGERLQTELTRQPPLSAAALEQEALRRSSGEHLEVPQSDRVRHRRRTRDELVATGEVGESATTSVSAAIPGLGEREKLVPRVGRNQHFSPAPAEGEARKRRKFEDQEEAKLGTEKSVGAKAASGSLYGTAKQPAAHRHEDDDDESDSSSAVTMYSSKGSAPTRFPGGGWPMPRLRRRQSANEGDMMKDTDSTVWTAREGSGGALTASRKIPIASNLVSYQKMWDELSSTHRKNVASYRSASTRRSRTTRSYATGGLNLPATLPSDAAARDGTTGAMGSSDTTMAEDDAMELQRAVENDFSSAILWNRLSIRPDTSVTKKYGDKSDDDRRRLRGGGDMNLSPKVHSFSNLEGDDSIGHETGQPSTTPDHVNFFSGPTDGVFLDGAGVDGSTMEQLRRGLYLPKAA